MGHFVTDSEWANELRGKLDNLCQQLDFHSFKDPIYTEWNRERDKKRLSDMFAALEEFADVEAVLVAAEAEKRWLKSLQGDLEPNDVRATVQRLNNELEDWEGDAADSFRTWLSGKEEKLNPGLELALTNCYDRATACWYAMDAYYETIKAFRDDARKAISTAETAIQEARELDRKLDLTVASAVTAIGAAAIGVATAGVGTAAVLAATAAVGSAMASAGSSYAILSIGSKNVPDIVAELQDCLYRIVQEAEGQLRHVGEAFRVVADHLVGSNLEQVRPRRPSVVTDDSFDPEQFRPEDASGQQVDDISTDDLVEEPGRETDNVPGNPGQVDRIEDRPKADTRT